MSYGLLKSDIRKILIKKFYVIIVMIKHIIRGIKIRILLNNDGINQRHMNIISVVYVIVHFKVPSGDLNPIGVFE